MKTFNAAKTGLSRSVKTWKGVLTVWFFYLIFVSLVVLPLRSSFKAGFGSSMITQEFKNGINLEIISDLKPVTATITNFLSRGMLFAFLFGIILNAFLTGGLFGSLRQNAERFSAAGFFGSSGRLFWKYLLITLIISVIILFVIVIFIVVPVSLASQGGSEKLPFITGLVSALASLIVASILISVADYARAKCASEPAVKAFPAIGFGFSRTFDKFRSSVPLEIIITVAQILFAILVSFLIGTWKPDTGFGVFLLLITSQVLFIIRIFIKTWRYGSMTCLMELNDIKPVQEPVKTDPDIALIQNDQIV